MKAKRMSARLLRYSMCFVFVADYRRMLEDRKEQPLTLCAGRAVICRARPVQSEPERGSTEDAVHRRARVYINQSVGVQQMFIP